MENRKELEDGRYRSNALVHYLLIKLESALVHICLSVGEFAQLSTLLVRH